MSRFLHKSHPPSVATTGSEKVATYGDTCQLMKTGDVSLCRIIVKKLNDSKHK